MTSVLDHRQHIRHPTDIPIYWTLHKEMPHSREPLRNISEGGLAFLSRDEVSSGSTIDIQIPLQNPEMQLTGTVVWCQWLEPEEAYEVGVSFQDATTRFRARMVEQICHIEHYKKDILEQEGRQLTSEQAALEWIHRYAREFPN